MPSIRSVSRALITVGAAVTIVAAGAAPASAVAVGEPACGTTPPPTNVCVTEVEGGDRIPVATVLGANLTAQELAHVVGYLESYRVPTGPSSYTDIPCVVLVTDGRTTDECANLGLTQTPDYEPIALVDGRVNDYNPTVKRLVDFYICEGRITATVGGFGPNQVLPTLCYETDPTDPIWFEAEPIDLGTWGT